MKKKLLFSLLAVAVIASGSTVYALNIHSAPVEIKNTANHIAKSDVSAPAATPQDAEATPAPEIATPVTPVTQPADTTPAQPTPEQNKAQIMTVITNYIAKLPQLSNASADAVSNYEFKATTCMDRYITGTLPLAGNGAGYTDYDAALNSSLMQKFLSGQIVFDGPGLCGITNRIPN